MATLAVLAACYLPSIRNARRPRKVTHRVALAALMVVAAHLWHSHRIHVHGEAPAHPHHVTIHGTIASSKTYSWRSEAVIDVSEIESTAPINAPLRLITTSTSPFPANGSPITLEGTLTSPAAARNPGEFDHRTFLRSRGIRAELLVPHHLRNLHPTTPKPPSWRDHTKDLVLHGNPQSPAAAVVRATLLGDRSSLTPDQLTTFRHAGVFHLFAVSGLHVGLLGVLVTTAARLLKAPLKLSLILAPPAMFIYALAVGSPPSAMRAAWMGTIGITIFLIDRKVRVTNLICIAALLLLINDSYLLFQPAFQFSFSALLGLVIVGSSLYQKLDSTLDHDPFIPKRLLTRTQRATTVTSKFLAGNACASLGAIAATAPFSIHYFNLVTPASIVGNLLLWPLTLAIISCGLATVLASIAHLHFIAAGLTSLNLMLGGLAERVATQCAQLPGGSLTITHDPPETARLTIYDLDDAACSTLLELPDQRPLAVGSGRTDMWRYTIQRHLTQISHNTPANWIVHHDSVTHNGYALTHPAKPDGSTTYVSEASTIAQLTLPDAHPLARGHHIPLTPNTSLEILFPPAGFSAARQDDRQLITRVHCGNWRILLLDAAGFLPCATVLAHAPETLRADIVVGGWPNHDVPLTSALLHYIKPKAIILRSPPISIPHARQRKLNQLLEQSGATIIRLRDHGAAIIEIDGQSLRVTGHVSGHHWEFNQSADASDRSSSPYPATAVQNQ
ncbi:ComEC/Rec2 family competence protein [Sulfuriroseicoccus oceanibius]|uniref:ComEC/Rec2 family competence protein n=1 Tax=Sulfuriroseicoccus oceanibius TaxID=2707525 RepID=A0A7T7JD79_9BACT|nr:ComEC/Rec2 family competence protein [Sulfuriroseicoccus oceanibius]